ncbi:hypothetical protein KSF_107170 [Reticulibacter mediterranei]|uniref:Uncharacterized protein n=1 Tax=Reticulibacter mediterranei TaxID=2778369 RepID=A0A8J3IZ84_9CHLR|nr:hypothetical protein KSF_107170 [Reticulibacter mediterranei]
MTRIGVKMNESQVTLRLGIPVAVSVAYWWDSKGFLQEVSVEGGDSDEYAIYHATEGEGPGWCALQVCSG